MSCIFLPNQIVFINKPDFLIKSSRKEWMSIPIIHHIKKSQIEDFKLKRFYICLYLISNSTGIDSFKQ